MRRLALLAAVAATVSACGGQDATITDRMAKEHAGDTPVPAAAADAADLGPLVTENVVYATVDGAPVTGFAAAPEDVAGPLPGLVVIHEWWGLNDNVRTMARRLADQGYLALAVDLYGGQVADTPDRARALMQQAMDHPEAARDNLRQAVSFLGERGAGRIGVIGWCFGGGWSLQAAIAMPESIDADVIYYGQLVTDPDLLARLDMPILGIFGGKDQGIPVERVRAFQAALEQLDKDVEIVVYPDASHAFANPSGTRYDPEAAADAWRRTVAFFDLHLKSGGSVTE